jgi:serine/threonine protein kinase
MLRKGEQPMPGFTLLRQRGVGGFAEVWDARDPSGGEVALKFLDCRSKPAAIIASEIRVFRGLAELRHPHIIELRGVYASSRYIIISMERGDGNLEDLRQAYQEETGKNIPPEHALDLLDQVAVGLDFLATVKLPGINQSSGGLQHCDVKPSNLLLLGETVKIADFGLAAGAGWHTHRKGWRGTPPYAAPELYRGQPSPGTDQFALAITYLKMIAGDRPFWPGDPTATPPTMPVDLTKLREKEVQVIARALHPEPLARWPSCTAFIAAMRQAMGVLSHPDGLPAKRLAPTRVACLRG